MLDFVCKAPSEAELSAVTDIGFHSGAVQRKQALCHAVITDHNPSTQPAGLWEMGFVKNVSKDRLCPKVGSVAISMVTNVK